MVYKVSTAEAFYRAFCALTKKDRLAVTRYILQDNEIRQFHNGSINVSRFMSAIHLCKRSQVFSPLFRGGKNFQYLHHRLLKSDSFVWFSG